MTSTPFGDALAVAASEAPHDRALDSSAWLVWAIPLAFVSLAVLVAFAKYLGERLADRAEGRASHFDRRAVMANGDTAWARVLELVRVEVPSWGRMLTLDLLVEVHPHGGPAFQAVARVRLDVHHRMLNAIGRSVPVRFDPNQCANVVLDEAALSNLTLAETH